MNPHQQLLLLTSIGFLTSQTSHAATASSEPNDPLFAWSESTPYYQWYLKNTGQNGGTKKIDVNVTPVWKIKDNKYTGYTGAGVTIGIIDSDPIQLNHPDLKANAISETGLNHTWTSSDSKNEISSDDNDHGTASAGIAAARGNNSIGITGSAPRASLVGQQVNDDDSDFKEYAEALKWHHDVIGIKSLGLGYRDTGKFMALNPSLSAALKEGVTMGRGGLGTIYVLPCGNGRNDSFADRSNYDGFNNAPETLSVAAVDHTGQQAPYSESGANLVVCAPSNSAQGDILPQSRKFPRNKVWSVDIQGDKNNSPDPKLAAPLIMVGSGPGTGYGKTWTPFTVKGYPGISTNYSQALLASTGAKSDVTFSINGTVSGWSENGPNLLTYDYLFVNAGKADCSITWEISGLIPWQKYTMRPYGGVARDIRITIDTNGDGSLAGEKSKVLHQFGLPTKNIIASANGSIIGKAEPGSQTEGDWSGFQLYEEITDPGVTTPTTPAEKGGYTYDFGHTSAVAPLVAGCVALILEANPKLGWRDVQEILIMSARPIEINDADWRTNGAGLHFNHKFGAGLIDTAAAVELAEKKKTYLGPRQTKSDTKTGLNLKIPEYNPKSTPQEAAEQKFDITWNPKLRVEHVQLTVDIKHETSEDLEISLVSPSGMESVFTEARENAPGDTRNMKFTFGSVRHWGEDSNGTWTVKVKDLVEETKGTVDGLTLTVFGTEKQPPATAP